MAEHTVLDARDLEPPEPLHRILAAIGSFGPADTLKVLIDYEPRALYPILDRGGFAHRTEAGIDSLYEVTIWPLANPN